MRTFMYGCVVLCLAVAGGTLVCTQQDNPFEDPGNASVSISALCGADTLRTRGDTTCFEVCLHLPYLADSVCVAIGDSVYRLAPPVDRDAVDWCDTICHVAADTGRLTAQATAWLGASEPLRVSADIHVNPSALDTASCRPLRPGDSINDALRAALASPADAASLCPEPGFYERGTVRVLGKLRLIVE